MLLRREDFEVLDAIVGSVAVSVMDVPPVRDLDSRFVENEPMEGHVATLYGQLVIWGPDAEVASVVLARLPPE